jgi:hypothetical protein
MLHTSNLEDGIRMLLRNFSIRPSKLNGVRTEKTKLHVVGDATAQVSRWFPTAQARVRSQRFVVDKVELRQVCPSHQMLYTHVPSGAGTIGQSVADIPSELNLNPLPRNSTVSAEGV